MVTKTKYSNIIPSIVAGTISSIIIIVSAMALSSLVFTGELSNYLPQGIGILLFGSLIFALFSAITASFPTAISAPQDIPIAILALMAATLMSNPSHQMNKEELFQFIFVTIGLTSVLVGIFFYLLGQFKLGKLVRFIPFPVVGGFLAGTGWLIVVFSFSMMTDLDLTLNNLTTLFSSGLLIRWVPGVLFAVILLFVTRKINHYLLVPGFLIVSIAIFYGIAFTSGLSFEQLENQGFLLGPFPDGGLFAGLPLQYVKGFQWSLFFQFTPALLTMMILNAISVLFNYSGLELTVKHDFDLNRELKMTGINNILVGMVGSSSGYVTVSESSMAFSIGAKSRLYSLTVAVFCGIALFFGAKVISFFPKVILGGLLLNLGISFLVEWLFDSWTKLNKGDYLVIVLILIVIGTVGFLEGIVVGLMMSIVLFVMNYSKVEVVKHELSGITFHSNVERSATMKKIIHEKGHQISILPLQGFIFFGTAHKLLEKVQLKIEGDGQQTLKYLIFDFRQVTGIDSSTLNSFNKLNIMAEKHGFIVLFCSLNEHTLNQFEIEGLFPDKHNIFLPFKDLDHGLEWCESQILNEYFSNNDLAIDGVEKDFFKSRFAELLDYFELKEVSKDITIIEQDKDPGGIYFLESGRITVQLDNGTGEKIRLKSMGPGTVVGEVSLYLGSKASASVNTEMDCRIYFLSKENFRKLNMAAPEKAAALHTYIVQLLSDRLAKSNATIKALMQ
jgi:SulP family sulfate permease